MHIGNTMKKDSMKETGKMLKISMKKYKNY